MNKDSHLMFENYVKARSAKLVTESSVTVPAEDQNVLQHSKQAEEAANSKRIIDLLNMLKNDANLATKLALRPEEFAGFIEWAKSKFAPSQAEETPSETSDASMGSDSMPSQDEESIKEAVAKANDELEAAKNLKPRSEETEEEYLARRDSAIKAAIAAKEEAEEHAAMQSHYNTQNQALDLIDNLLKSPKKYQKADTIKILSLALDKLNGKA